MKTEQNSEKATHSGRNFMPMLIVVAFTAAIVMSCGGNAAVTPKNSTATDTVMPHEFSTPVGEEESASPSEEVSEEPEDDAPSFVMPEKLRLTMLARAADVGARAIDENKNFLTAAAAGDNPKLTESLFCSLIPTYIDEHVTQAARELLPSSAAQYEEYQDFLLSADGAILLSEARKRARESAAKHLAEQYPSLTQYMK